MDRASYKSVGAPKYVWSASVQSGCMWDQTLEKWNWDAEWGRRTL